MERTKGGGRRIERERKEEESKETKREGKVGSRGGILRRTRRKDKRDATRCPAKEEEEE